MKDNAIGAAVLYALAIGLGLLSIFDGDGSVAFIGFMPTFIGTLMLNEAFDMEKDGL